MRSGLVLPSPYLRARDSYFLAKTHFRTHNAIGRGRINYVKTARRLFTFLRNYLVPCDLLRESFEKVGDSFLLWGIKEKGGKKKIHPPGRGSFLTEFFVHRSLKKEPKKTLFLVETIVS